MDFVSPNAILQEQSLGIHYNEGLELTDYVINKTDFDLTHGNIAPLPGPGLGVEVDRDFVMEQSKIPHNWETPRWRHSDGSVSEW